MQVSETIHFQRVGVGVGVLISAQWLWVQLCLPGRLLTAALLMCVSCCYSMRRVTMRVAVAVSRVACCRHRRV
jgi:hypothetical protein